MISNIISPHMGNIYRINNLVFVAQVSPSPSDLAPSGDGSSGGGGGGGGGGGTVFQYPMSRWSTSRLASVDTATSHWNRSGATTPTGSVVSGKSTTSYGR